MLVTGNQTSIYITYLLTGKVNSCLRYEKQVTVFRTMVYLDFDYASAAMIIEGYCIINKNIWQDDYVLWGFRSKFPRES
jgi:hypothetical protein